MVCSEYSGPESDAYPVPSTLVTSGANGMVGSCTMPLLAKSCARIPPTMWSEEWPTGFDVVIAWGSADSSFRPLTLPKLGSAGLGFIISSRSSSTPRERSGDWLAYLDVCSPDTMIGFSSKLTRLDFFLESEPTESLMPTSEDGAEKRTSGEAVLTDDEGECFNADLAGEADRPKG